MFFDLTTPQGEALLASGATAWTEYPRPQMRRESYVNLNGLWDFAVGETLPVHYDRQIVVPFCPESAISGVQTHFPEGSRLYYRRRFTLPKAFNRGKVLLHIGAADQICTIYVNQQEIGTHRGGYEAFAFDITDALLEDNELVILCIDDLRDQSFPYGKQRIDRGGMWYTPVSGIWQTVWLESVPVEAISQLHVENRGAAVTISIQPALEGQVILGDRSYPLTQGSVTVQPEDPHFWSPEDPYLYPFTVETACDRVESYFALRTLEIKTVGGYPRLCLNGSPYFFHGLLDQGYWPDGIYTPASSDCYAQDILEMKKLGFNTLRKHIKVEPEIFYYLCDKLGMVVFQDMVNNSDYSFFRDTALPTVGIQKLDDRKLHRDPESRRMFLSSMEATVAQLRNHPCILYWTIFNEGWGQFCSADAYHRLRQLDDTRWIDATSGWFRRGESDVDSLHIYFGSWKKLKAGEKPLVLSEFGGYAYAVPEHLFNPDKAYGYKSCTGPEDFQNSLETLYRTKILPAVSQGLCAAICTQVSDVEDEINGMVTYDRKVCKADPARMIALAQDLQKAIQ